jgi:hypothetical protein
MLPTQPGLAFPSYFFWPQSGKDGKRYRRSVTARAGQDLLAFCDRQKMDRRFRPHLARQKTEGDVAPNKRRIVALRPAP